MSAFWSLQSTLAPVPSASLNLQVPFRSFWLHFVRDTLLAAEHMRAWHISSTSFQVFDGTQMIWKGWTSNRLTNFKENRPWIWSPWLSLPSWESEGAKELECHIHMISCGFRGNIMQRLDRFLNLKWRTIQCRIPDECLNPSAMRAAESQQQMVSSYMTEIFTWISAILDPCAPPRKTSRSLDEPSWPALLTFLGPAQSYMCSNESASNQNFLVPSLVRFYSWHLVACSSQALLMRGFF